MIKANFAITISAIVMVGTAGIGLAQDPRLAAQQRLALDPRPLTALTKSADGNGENRSQDAEIKRLVEKLGSKKFAVREAALKGLKEIGRPALPALRHAVEKATDPEVRQAAKSLIGVDFEKMFEQGVEQETVAKNYRRAVEIFCDIGKLMHADDPSHRAKQEGISKEPERSDLLLHLARCYWALGNFEEATRSFSLAMGYASSRDERAHIDQERKVLISQLTATFATAARKRIGGSPALRALINKYQFVFLTARRCGGYDKCTFSFIYGTSDPQQHRNDVQLLFDNGGEPRRLSINMLGGQENLIADLGDVDFEKNFDPKTVDVTKEKSWSGKDAEAIEGHVYLERVKDTRGNLFFVQFKVLVVDPGSRYVALVWRRLPGGKLVRTH